jgi:hypothetical protein
MGKASRRKRQLRERCVMATPNTMQFFVRGTAREASARVNQLLEIACRHGLHVKAMLLPAEKYHERRKSEIYNRV